MSPKVTSASKTALTLSAAALAYAERGWPVFPLKARDKTPLTRTGFKVATCDPAVIESWWDHWPTANIGIATGHDFDVLDIDGDLGRAALREFWTRRGITYHHDGPVSLTGKGWHMLFQNTGHGNGADLLGGGSKLDFRGLGGYIAAAPSIHPLGHTYRWDEHRGPDTPLPPPPDWLFELLNRDDNPAAAPAKPKPIIIANLAFETLVEGGYIPRDQTPRGVQNRLQRPDILQVCADKGITLRQRTHYWVAACVYHEDSTPSMAIYTSNNTFHCYGCGAYGDSIDLEAGTHLG